MFRQRNLRDHRNHQKPYQLKANLVEINPDDYKDSPDKIEFLGTYAKPDAPKLLRSTNKVKVNALLSALQKCTGWEQPIFSDPNLPYYAMTAFLQDKINREQITQILEYWELKATYPDVIAIPILDEKGNLTKLGCSYFDSQTNQTLLPKFTALHKAKFHAAIASKPQPLRVFNSLFLIPSSTDKSRFVGATSLRGSVDGSPYGTIYVPATVRNIFLPAITPKDSTKTTSVGALGHFSLDMMDENHRKNKRLQAVVCPGSATTTRIHDFNTTQVDTSGHDGLHQVALSFFPKQLDDLMRIALDTLRAVTKIRWSSEMWPLVDLFVIDKSTSELNNKKVVVSTTVNESFFYSQAPKNQVSEYAPDEALSPLQLQDWAFKIFQNTFIDRISKSKTLLSLIFLHMLQHPSVWKEWVVFEEFKKNYIPKEIFAAFAQALSFKQITEQNNIADQLELGYLANWDAIVKSALFPFFRFRRDRRNYIHLALFDQQLTEYTDKQLKTLLSDIENNNLTGINLIKAVIVGDIAKINACLSELKQGDFDYIGAAVRVAAINGHADSLATLLGSKLAKFNYENQGGDVFYETIRNGHLACVKMLLPESTQESLYIDVCIHFATHYQKADILRYLLSLNPVLDTRDAISSTHTLFNALGRALQRNNPEMVRQIISQIEKISKMDKLFDELFKYGKIYDFLKYSPTRCIRVLMQTRFPNQHLPLSKLFKIIAKLGSIECAEEFVAEVQDRTTLKSCMLAGFKHVLPGQGHNQPYNSHSDMVKFQLNLYLTIAREQNTLKADIDALILQIFSDRFEYNNVCHETLSEPVLQQLLNHPIIKDDPELSEYTLRAATKLALNHAEPHYLRLLLHAGAVLPMADIDIGRLHSKDVQCLVWLVAAVQELNQSNPNSEKVNSCLRSAESLPTFSHEMIALMSGVSLPINLTTMQALVGHIKDKKTQELLQERIELLRWDGLQCNEQILYQGPQLR